MYDFSLRILALLIGRSVVTSSERVQDKKAYLIVTLGFLFFETPLYLRLLGTDRQGWTILFAAERGSMADEPMGNRPAGGYRDCVRREIEFYFAFRDLKWAARTLARRFCVIVGMRRTSRATRIATDGA